MLLVMSGGLAAANQISIGRLHLKTDVGQFQCPHNNHNGCLYGQNTYQLFHQ